MPNVMPVIADISLAFGSVTSIAGISVRLETLALAGIVLVALVLTAWIARREPVDAPRPPGDAGEEPVAGGAPDSALDAGEPGRLRLDDLLVLVVAAIPGAVIGGRLGYGLVHLDFFSADPGALLDPGRGGLELPLAVLGGIVTAAGAAAILAAPIRRWLHVATLPLLLAVAGGKLALALGGTGQGIPFDGPWATAYLGPGPWGSIAPAVPSHPAQLYEAMVACVVIVLVGGAVAVGAFRGHRGGAFAVGVALWLVGRAAIEVTWRDPAVLGPLRADQAVSLALAAVALALAVADGVRTRRPEPAP